MKLTNNLVQKNIFTLLTAPVAKGKTFSVMELYDEHQFRMIFVSPLRALANEVYQKFLGQKNIYLLGGQKTQEQSKNDCLINFLQKQKALLITTVELLENEFVELLEKEARPILFVLDEFHLFYSWGESFRPILHDTFLGILSSEHPVLALSATMNQISLEKLINDLKYDRDYWVHLDYGNLELKWTPAHYHYFGGQEKVTLEKMFARELYAKKTEEVLLMFCAYRAEVDEKVAWALRQGFMALGCVGGEVEEFQQSLRESEKIDCIFATSTLSHGVNLPEISKVFINYEVKDYDFWLQMIGRGGRSGRSYEVFTFDAFHLTKSERLKKKIWTHVQDWLG